MPTKKNHVPGASSAAKVTLPAGAKGKVTRANCQKTVDKEQRDLKMAAVSLGKLQGNTKKNKDMIKFWEMAIVDIKDRISFLSAVMTLLPKF